MTEVLKLENLVLVYGVISTFTFIAYALDKFAAKNGFYRIPELTLHFLAVGGGWPGALLAQTVFKHKTTKVPFRIVFWITVVFNVGMLITLSSFFGRDFNTSG